ncbi:MAG TPA: hypothetical protein VHM70_00105 [Polyangiaceae bacterium]|nr:hypothetical protein [Polyangiaceae bacterium]
MKTRLRFVFATGLFAALGCGGKSVDESLLQAEDGGHVLADGGVHIHPSASDGGVPADTHFAGDGSVTAPTSHDDVDDEIVDDDIGPPPPATQPAVTPTTPGSAPTGTTDPTSTSPTDTTVHPVPPTSTDPHNQPPPPPTQPPTTPVTPTGVPTGGPTSMPPTGPTVTVDPPSNPPPTGTPTGTTTQPPPTGTPTGTTTQPPPTGTPTGTTTQPPPTGTPTGTTTQPPPTGTPTGTTTEPPPTGTPTGTTTQPPPTGTTTSQPPPDGPPSDCDEYQHNLSSSDCSLGLDCKDGDNYTYCYLTDSKKGLWSCNCQLSDYDKGSYTYRSANLSNVGSNDPCEFTSNLCSTGNTIIFDGPESCDVTESIGTGSCSNTNTCTQSEEFTGGLTAEMSHSLEVDCYQSDDLWNCYCSGDKSGSFDATTSLDRRHLCAAGNDVCETDLTPDPNEPSACVNTNSYASHDGKSCNAQIDCGQTRELTDLDITVYSTLYSSCRRNADTNGWDCSCNNSAGDSADFDFTTSASGGSACYDAANYCHDQNLVPLVSGNSGGGVPIPLAE